jgi:hypothetical protein
MIDWRYFEGNGKQGKKIVNSSTLKMEKCPSEMSVGFHRTTWSYVPQDITIVCLLLHGLLHAYKSSIFMQCSEALKRRYVF